MVNRNGRKIGDIEEMKLIDDGKEEEMKLKNRIEIK